MPSFKESLQKLSSETKEVMIGGAPFNLKKIAVKDAFALDQANVDEGDKTGQMLLLIKVGVDIGDATDEDITDMPVEHLNDLVKEITVYNGMDVDLDDESADISARNEDEFPAPVADEGNSTPS